MLDEANGVGLQFNHELLHEMLDDLLALRQLDGAIVFAGGKFNLDEHVYAFSKARTQPRPLQRRLGS